MSTKQTGRRTAEEWSRIVAAWRASGETSKVFAARHRLNARTLLFYSHQLGKTGRPKKALDFLEVQLAEPPVATKSYQDAKAARRTGSMEVVTRSGRVIRWEGPMDPEAFKAMLEVVESC